MVLNSHAPFHLSTGDVVVLKHSKDRVRYLLVLGEPFPSKMFYSFPMEVPAYDSWTMKVIHIDASKASWIRPQIKVI